MSGIFFSLAKAALPEVAYRSMDRSIGNTRRAILVVSSQACRAMLRTSKR